MWPALDFSVRRRRECLTQPRPFNRILPGRGSNALLVPRAQAAQQHARQKAAGTIGQGPAGAISTNWWKFSKARSLDKAMMLRQSAAPGPFRRVAAGDRMPDDAPL